MKSDWNLNNDIVDWWNGDYENMDDFNRFIEETWESPYEAKYMSYEIFLKILEDEEEYLLRSEENGIRESWTCRL